MTFFRQLPVSHDRERARPAGLCNPSGPFPHPTSPQKTVRDTLTVTPCKQAGFGMSRRSRQDATLWLWRAFRSQPVSANPESRSQIGSAGVCP